MKQDRIQTALEKDAIQRRKGSEARRRRAYATIAEGQICVVWKRMKSHRIGLQKKKKKGTKFIKCKYQAFGLHIFKKLKNPASRCSTSETLNLETG